MSEGGVLGNTTPLNISARLFGIIAREDVQRQRMDETSTRHRIVMRMKWSNGSQLNMIMLIKCCIEC